MGTDLNKNFFLCKFNDTFKCSGYTSNNGQIKNIFVNPYDSSIIYSITTRSIFKVSRNQFSSLKIKDILNMPIFSLLIIDT
jgi:hypothetical protein